MNYTLRNRGAFKIKGKNKTLVLQPHGSGSIHITFTPREVGSFRGTLYLENNLTKLSRVKLEGKGGEGLLRFMRAGDDAAATLNGTTAGGRVVGLSLLSKIVINATHFVEGYRDDDGLSLLRLPNHNLGRLARNTLRPPPSQNVMC